jgi:hypothetical protein
VPPQLAFRIQASRVLDQIAQYYPAHECTVVL